MKTIRVKMLTECNGSPDGVTVNVYEADEEYDLPEALARQFIKGKAAETVKKTASTPADDAETAASKDVEKAETPEKPKRGKR